MIASYLDTVAAMEALVGLAMPRAVAVTIRARKEEGTAARRRLRNRVAANRVETRAVRQEVAAAAAADERRADGRSPLSTPAVSSSIDSPSHSSEPRRQLPPAIL